MGDDGSRRRVGRPGSMHLLFWMTVALVIAFLPVALYVPYLLSGVSGANSSRSARAQLLCDPSCLGPGGRALLASGLSGSSATERLSLEYSTAPATRLLSQNTGPSRARAVRTYVLADDIAVATMGNSRLVASPVSATLLRHPFSGTDGALGEIVRRDPLVLLCKTADLARAGLDVRGLSTWTSVGSAATKLRALVSTDPAPPRPILVSSEDLFVPLLYQNRGRICDGGQLPLFQFGEGQAALSTIRYVLEAGGARGNLTSAYGLATIKSFASGVASMLVAKRSLQESPGLLPTGTAILSRPLPQTEGGAFAMGGTTSVLTGYPSTTAPQSTQTTQEFMLLSAQLTGKFAPPKNPDEPASEWRSTTSELVFLGHHGSELSLTTLSILAGTQRPLEGLRELSQRIRWLDTQQPKPAPEPR